MAYARFDHRPASLLPALATEVRRKLPRFSPQARSMNTLCCSHNSHIGASISTSHKPWKGFGAGTRRLGLISRTMGRIRVAVRAEVTLSIDSRTRVRSQVPTSFFGVLLPCPLMQHARPQEPTALMLRAAGAVEHGLGAVKAGGAGGTRRGAARRRGPGHAAGAARLQRAERRQHGATLPAPHNSDARATVLAKTASHLLQKKQRWLELKQCNMHVAYWTRPQTLFEMLGLRHTLLLSGIPDVGLCQLWLQAGGGQPRRRVGGGGDADTAHLQLSEHLKHDVVRTAFVNPSRSLPLAEHASVCGVSHECVSLKQSPGLVVCGWIGSSVGTCM